ncbi:MAG: hypothetical protein KF883_01690 [Thermomicrobiales bacterium]|nr:hypothetical protein [Thermomicrobiales bacterium]
MCLLTELCGPLLTIDHLLGMPLRIEESHLWLNDAPGLAAAVDGIERYRIG